MGFKFTDRICNIEINERVYPVVFQKPLIDRLPTKRTVPIQGINNF